MFIAKCGIKLAVRGRPRIIMARRAPLARQAHRPGSRPAPPCRMHQ